MNWFVRLTLIGALLVTVGIMTGRLATLDKFIDFLVGWAVINLIVLGGRWVYLGGSDEAHDSWF